MKVAMNQLEIFRKQIDEIDAEVMALLNERIVISEKIGQFKKQAMMELIDTRREHQVLKQVTALAESPALKQHIQKVYESIIDACRQVQIS